MKSRYSVSKLQGFHKYLVEISLAMRTNAAGVTDGSWMRQGDVYEHVREVNEASASKNKTKLNLKLVPFFFLFQHQNEV